MEFNERIVVEGEKYPRQYIHINKVRGKAVTTIITIPHPPSEQALKDFAYGIKNTIDKQMFENL